MSNSKLVEGWVWHAIGTWVLGFHWSDGKEGLLFSESFSKSLSSILTTSLISANKIKTIKTYANLHFTYSFELIKCSNIDLKGISRTIRTKITGHRMHHRGLAIERMALPRLKATHWLAWCQQVENSTAIRAELDQVEDHPVRSTWRWVPAYIETWPLMHSSTNARCSWTRLHDLKRFRSEMSERLTLSLYPCRKPAIEAPIGRHYTRSPQVIGW